MDASASRQRCLRSRASGLTDDRFIAERCWDLAELGEGYQEFICLHTSRIARYRRGVTGRKALEERMELVQAYRRFPFRDPDLPEPLLPPRWRGGPAHVLFVECDDALRDEAEAFVRSAQGL
ncbi:PaaX family transcriptional regulator C-terminal domain-containing protein [Rhodococcus sp. WWJCD1]|uniref:PaaX family transcriptional regulator C-terminal domain-containing protein n=1 Tax=Rhodococcus sp. WWJCD1 TaxID=2022519 RepID=UPI0020CE7351|nr:PaaX family transcriptional regulator C-terminal domain-containing protein [Rhodococcus sp. WWJCD1]